jgi:hypothetical protein
MRKMANVAHVKVITFMFNHFEESKMDSLHSKCANVSLYNVLHMHLVDLSFFLIGCSFAKKKFSKCVHCANVRKIYQ